MPSPTEIMMRERRNYERPGARRNRKIRSFGQDLLDDILDPVNFIRGARGTVGAVTGSTGSLLQEIMNQAGKVQVVNPGDEDYIQPPPGGWRTYEAVHGEQARERWRNQQGEPSYLIENARDETPAPSRTTKPVTAREKKRVERHARKRQELYEALGLDARTAKAMANADVSTMKPQTRRDVAEDEGTLPGTNPPSIEPVEWGDSEEPERGASADFGDPDTMELGELYNLVVELGGTPHAQLTSSPQGVVLRPQDVFDVLSGEQNPLVSQYHTGTDEELQQDIRAGLADELNMLINGQLEPESNLLEPPGPAVSSSEPYVPNFAGAPSHVGNTQLPGLWRESVAEGSQETTPAEEGGFWSSLWDFANTPGAEVLGLTNSEETAPPTTESIDVDAYINALSEEQKEAEYQAIRPVLEDIITQSGGDPNEIPEDRDQVLRDYAEIIIQMRSSE